MLKLLSLEIKCFAFEVGIKLFLCDRSFVKVVKNGTV